MKVEKVFCTTTEAAAILAISVGTVQLWVDKGLLVAWKTAGGHRRVTRESINKILHASPTAQPKTPATVAPQNQTACIRPCCAAGRWHPWSKPAITG